jgi:hypothetical protein
LCKGNCGNTGKQSCGDNGLDIEHGRDSHNNSRRSSDRLSEPEFCSGLHLQRRFFSCVDGLYLSLQAVRQITGPENSAFAFP